MLCFFSFNSSVLASSKVSNIYSLMIDDAQQQGEWLNLINSSCFENYTMETLVARLMRCAPRQPIWVVLRSSFGSTLIISFLKALISASRGRLHLGFMNAPRSEAAQRWSGVRPFCGNVLWKCFLFHSEPLQNLNFYWFENTVFLWVGICKWMV